MERDVIIVVVFTCLLLVPFVLYIISDIINEYKYRKQFKELKIGDRYIACLTPSYETPSYKVFEEPKYIYLKITNKKEKDGIYYVQYKFEGTDIKKSMRFDRFLELYFKP